MKITYNWLKDFVDISLKPEALAEKLTMAGLEVTALEKFEDDYVFEIEVTSNRPDWLSVAGIAREAAAITKSKIKKSLPAGRQEKSKSQFKIQNLKKETTQFKINITDKNACPFYSARIIRNVKVKPSPSWLVKRIQAIGLRPINNIVDITNYVLFTTGQPLHAFDLDKLKGKEISVRFAKDREEILTIDGIERKLTSEILVITDENNPIAIAGIMGGKKSEVNTATQNVLLESAYFSPIVTRRVSRLSGLSSDSSYRFERSVDKGNIVNASNFALSLILENAGGEAGSLYKRGSDTVSKKSISFTIDKANKLIGQDLPTTKTKAILNALGFKISSEKKNILKVKVPDFRQDIKSQADVTEELCRIYGYENIPLTLPAVKPGGIQEDESLAIAKRIRETLTALGFSEVITYSLFSEENLKKAGIALENAACLENPLSVEQKILRPALFAGLLNTLGRNLDLGSERCAFFEIGDCFSRTSEFSSLGLLADKADLLEFKGKLELLLQKLGVRDYKFLPSSRPFFQEGRSAALIIDQQELGIIGQFKKEILLAFKIDNREALALELNLDKLKTYVNFQKTYQNLPKYPSVTRDISLLAEEGLAYQNIAQIIRACGLENLEAVSFKDLYRSAAIGKGKKSLTISLEFRSAKGTLTDIEVKSYMDTVLAQLCREANVELKTAASIGSSTP
ncbi:MAG: phenylalanine--tRNA ligase subunit beta [Omnitrophica WOR_2 bacterium RIFCSPLOWO2_02_FULL_45_28]|nr:MAG: phenylalanine--tRNA ligase subunit beta [Omnitrophica WOR_2 bacterium RIFCSPLOWO2_02_FULL_45_28]